LGYSLAQGLVENHEVYVTGRREPEGMSKINFCALELATDTLGRDIAKLLERLPAIDLLVYAAGFYQDGTITDLDVHQIYEMIDVGLVAPILFVRELLERQKTLEGFIAITSTSQWTPRLAEPVYTAAKAGLGAVANSLSLDDRIGKTLVAAPAGMDTPFWAGTDKDTSTMLDPDWVARQIIAEYSDASYQQYKFVRILRGDPAQGTSHRVDSVEVR
jgi:NAD(P)-dependent dehydrogenase (short-subunit alcohol dehydrogenase family)